MKSPLYYFLLRCEKRFLCKCIFSSRGGWGRDNKKIRLVNCKCGCCIIFQKIWGLAPFFCVTLYYAFRSSIYIFIFSATAILQIFSTFFASLRFKRFFSIKKLVKL